MATAIDLEIARAAQNSALEQVERIKLEMEAIVKDRDRWRLRCIEAENLVRDSRNSKRSLEVTEKALAEKHKEAEDEDARRKSLAEQRRQMEKDLEAFCKQLHALTEEHYWCRGDDD